MFDPYHKWLAIPKDQRPPSYYQLLGVAPNEQDPEVIDEAALRQMAHVRAYQLGSHAAVSQRILNEISQARTVLLNAQKRKAYDETLAPKADPAAARVEAPPDLAVAVSAGPAPAASQSATEPWKGQDELDRPPGHKATAAGISVRKPSGALPLVVVLAVGGGVVALGLAIMAVGAVLWLGRGGEVRLAQAAVVENAHGKDQREVLFSDADHQLACLVVPGIGNTDTLVLYALAGKHKVSSTPVIQANFAPCHRGISTDGKYYLQSTLKGGLDFWAIGNPQRVIGDWSIKEPKVKPGAVPNNDEAALWHAFFIGADKLVTLTRAGSLEIWQVPAMRSLLRVPGSGKSLPQNPVIVSPDRRRCALFTGTSYRILDTHAGKQVCETQPLPPGDGGQRLTLPIGAFSPDSARFVAGVHEGGRKPALYCYDAATGALASVAPDLTVPNNRLHFRRISWFGPEHFYLTWTGQKMLSSCFAPPTAR